MAIVMLILPYDFKDIRKSNKIPMFDLENEGHDEEGEKKDLCH